jgi:hypothetical protein
MFWKIYFILLVAFLFYGYQLLAGQLNAWYYIDLLISLLSLVGLFGLAWKQRFFSAHFWKTYFTIYLMWELVFNLIIDPYVNKTELGFSIILGFAMFLPLYASLYIYGFKFLKR